MDSDSVLGLMDWLYLHSEMSLSDVRASLGTAGSMEHLNGQQIAILYTWISSHGKQRDTSRLFHKRPSWDKLYLQIADIMSSRSTCPRLSCGAVVVSVDNQILSSGYNGAVRGEAHCLDAGCRLEGGHCVRAVHAEANAIVQGARLGTTLKGATLYATDRPCVRCAGLIVQSGIARVVYARDYSSDGLDEAVRQLFERLGVHYSLYADER